MTKTPVALSLAIALSGVMIISLILGILPLYLNKFPLTTPDAGGLACAAEVLTHTNHFNPGRTNSPNFAICWTKEHYPVVQFMNAAILKITPLQSWQVVPITALGMYLGCVLGLCYIGYMLTKRLSVAVTAGILAAASPALLRSLILTPQNVYGYFWIVIFIVAFIHLILHPRWYWWIALIMLTPVLAFTHTLSFGIAAIAFALWFWLFFLERWLYRLIVAGIGGVMILITERWQLLPVSVSSALSLFRSSFSGYDHPVYDHPAIWGYLITALAVVGMVLAKKLSYKIRWLFISLIFTPVILGHLSFVGLQLLPERFIPFAWLGLVPLATLGVYELGALVRWPRTFWTASVICILGAQIIHAAVFIKDDVDGWSARFRPKPEFIQAMQWLNQQPNKGALLGIMAVSNREISFAPLWYTGMIENYPWYNLDHKDIKNLQANSSLYQPILANPSAPEYQRIHTLYTLITTPNDPSLITTLPPYQLSYFVLPKTSQAYKLWQKEASLPFSLIYENNKYVIYAL